MSLDIYEVEHWEDSDFAENNSRRHMQMMEVLIDIRDSLQTLTERLAPEEEPVDDEETDEPSSFVDVLTDPIESMDVIEVRREEMIPREVMEARILDSLDETPIGQVELRKRTGVQCVDTLGKLLCSMARQGKIKATAPTLYEASRYSLPKKEES